MQILRREFGLSPLLAVYRTSIVRHAAGVLLACAWTVFLLISSPIWFVTCLYTTLADGYVDALIRNAGETAFVGANVFGPEPQTKTQTVEARRAAVYEFQVRYIGSTRDTVRLQGTAGGTGWTVKYFDAWSDGREMTAQATSPAGHAWTNVPSGTVKAFRIEVTPGLSAAGDQGKDVYVILSPDLAPNRRDISKASTRCLPRAQPDLLLRREYDVRFIGENLYNMTGAGQTKAQETEPNVPVPYFLQLVNDGNLTDQFLLQAHSAVEGWRERYYDAGVAGNDITDQVTGGGWLSPPMPLTAIRDLRMEVAGGTNVQGVSVSQIRLTATSRNSPNRADAVRVVTAVIPDSTTPQGGVYTDDEDFEKGTLAGVTYEAVPDQLQTSDESVTLPFIWVPNSDQSTVSKVDTRTGRELARYRTCPERQSGNPSRTTIDQQGNCWVANRQSGTVVKIGLLEGGQYVDRNHDDIIQTSMDGNGDGDITGGELLGWGEDECVMWEVVLIPDREGTYAPGEFAGEYVNDQWNPGPRGVAVDAQGNVWLGTYESRRFYHVDGRTAQILQVVDFSQVDHASYGAVIDAQGIVWSAGLYTGNVLRLDPSSRAFSVVDIGHNVYGLGLDRSNHLFVAGWQHAKLSRVNVLTARKEWTVDGIDRSRGVAVTQDGDVWTADSGPGTVTRWSNDGVMKATIWVGATPTGVSVDASGKIWVVNNGDEYIKRIDPLLDAVDLEKRILGGHHYGYSDMTGIIARTATTRLGVWTVVHDSRFPGATWGTLSWTAASPEGTHIGVRARSSPDRRRWSFWEAATNGLPLRAVPAGKFLQIEATLQIIQGDNVPVLYDLTVTPVEREFDRPELLYRLIEQSRLDLSWDLTAENATLESAQQVVGPWQPVPGVAGNRHAVSVSSGTATQFYRLRLE